VKPRILPPAARRFAELLTLLRSGAEDHGYVLAGLNDLISGLAPGELRDAVEHADLSGLSDFLQNYVAAMVEQGCYLQGVPPPGWTMRVTPLEQPYFATSLKSFRLHLLRASPVPYKRRNIFVDAGIGARV
jgi:hypothetical protein